MMTNSQHPHGRKGFYTKRAYGCCARHHTRPAVIHSEKEVLESRPFTTLEHARLNRCEHEAKALDITLAEYFALEESEAKRLLQSRSYRESWAVPSLSDLFDNDGGRV